MWVIKIGGSLLGCPELPLWLDLFARLGDGNIVIVPGGSIFADAVRESQKRSGCSDAVAHKMAVLAMDQYGVLLAGLNPALVTAESELEIAERCWQHRAIVWLPSKMACADEGIPANWQVTSDSLAAWLAGKLNAEHLILIKSGKPEGKQISMRRLIEGGIVDELFADFTTGQNFNTWILGKQDYSAFKQHISAKELDKIGLSVR